jgi:hypothetical protein
MIDEFGSFPTSRDCAELLFDVIAIAYKLNSLIVATNLPFESWTKVLGSERLTSSALAGSLTASTFWRPREKATDSRTPSGDVGAQADKTTGHTTTCPRNQET